MELSRSGPEGSHCEPESLGAGRHLRLVRRAGWEYAERTAGMAVVVIVAVTDDDRLVLVEQYRIPVGRTVIELPAGLVGDGPQEAGEDLLAAARRELIEETGYDAREFISVGEGPSSAGLTSEVVTFVRAVGLRAVGPGGGDAHEVITVHQIPLPEVADWLQARARQGALVDPKVYAGLYLTGLCRPR